MIFRNGEVGTPSANTGCDEERIRAEMDLYDNERIRKMVIVEDDILLKDSLCLYFQSKGCEVSAFESAEDALEAMGRDRYGVIISDHWLPGMDGLSLMDRVLEISPETVRILITGQPEAGIAEEAIRAGVDDFILKPFTPEEIEEVLERHVGRGRKGAADAQ